MPLTRDLGQNATSDLWHCHLTFRRSSEITDLGWSHTYLQWLLWHSLGFLVVPRPSMWPIFHKSLFIWSLERFRCLLVPLPQFGCGRFFRWGWHSSPRECSTSQILDQDTKITYHSVKNLTGNTSPPLTKATNYRRPASDNFRKHIFVYHYRRPCANLHKTVVPGNITGHRWSLHPNAPGWG